MKGHLLRLFLVILTFIPCVNATKTYATNYVSDVAVAAGSSRESCYNQLKNNGYTPIDRDLNQDAGGAYIYMGYKTSTNYMDGITNLIVSIDSRDTITIDNYHYSMVKCLNGFDGNGNLNHETNGKKLYLKYTKDGKKDGALAITKLELHTKIDANYTYVSGYSGDHKDYEEMDLNKGAGGIFIYIYMGKMAYTGGSSALVNDMSVENLGGGYYKFVIPINQRDSMGVLNSISGEITVNDRAHKSNIFKFEAALYYGTECMKDDKQQNVDTMTIPCKVLEGEIIDYRTFESFQSWSTYNCLIEGGDHKTHRYITILWKAPSTYNYKSFSIWGLISTNKEGKERSDFLAHVDVTPPAAADAMSAPVVIDPFLNVESGEPGWATLNVTGVNKMLSFAYVDDVDRALKPLAIDEGATNVTINLEPREEEHHLTVLSLIKKQEIGSDGTQDYGYTLAAVPVVQKAFHKIQREDDVAEQNPQQSPYLLNPTIKWKMKNPRDEDLIAEDMFLVERAFNSDFSDAEVLGSVSFIDSLEVGDNTYAHYSFVDENENGRNNPKGETDDNIFAKWDLPSGWQNIGSSAKGELENLAYPAHYTYYRASRSIVKSLWEKNRDYEVRWRVLNDNVLPTITNVSLAKTDKWDSDHSVNVNIKLANPYPWEIVSPFDSATVHAEAVRQGFTHRLYRWNPNARIRVERYSDDEDHYKGVDEVAKTFYISGSDVKFNEQTGDFEAVLEDYLGAPYTHYFYKAIVDTTNVGWPVSEKNTYVSIDRNDRIYFEDIAPVSNLTATRGTVQGQVTLSWDPSDATNRTYTIERSEYGKSEWLQLDSISECSYNDANLPQAENAAKPGVVYEYRVTAHALFRGTTHNSTPVTTVGYNPYYGTISGRVKLSNGAAMPGDDLTVVVSRSTQFSIGEVTSPSGDVIMPGHEEDHPFSIEIKVKDGIFRCDTIPYLADSTTHYKVNIKSAGNVQFKNASGNIGEFDVAFTNEDFIHNAIDFTCDNVLTVSGRVLYDGSTVPVRDVCFSVNGAEMKDANSKNITTDSEGNFSFLLPKGMSLSLKATRKGHTFVGDGYIVGSANQTKPLTDNISGKVLYDKTTVRLVGRIVGGELQAKAPLGMAISHNNLGDNLRMELQLEGDNTSNIVYDLKHPEKDTRDVTFTQPVEIEGTKVDTIATAVSFQRKRILLTPNVATGEFCVDLFPTKYKITGISAKGYSTLTNEGEGFEILDLSNSIDTISVDNLQYLASPEMQSTKMADKRMRSTWYQATYQRVYHVPATVSVEQYDITGALQPYLGEKTLKELNLQGEKMNVQVASVQNDSVHYAFGYPVFSDLSKYRFRVTAHEDYYYNNDTKRSPEKVNLTGGNLTIYNGLESATSKLTAQLNSKGQADVVLNVDNPCFNLTDTAALRSVIAEVEFNGYYYRADAIRGFIVGQKDAGTEVMPLDNTINIVDVIRDPYGSRSYAWRDAGTEYHWDRSVFTIETLNFQIDLGFGGGGTWYIGIGMAEKASYSLMGGANINIPMRKNFGSTYGEYTMTLNERIQTSDDPTMVGAMADVYVGYSEIAHLREVTAMTLADSAGFARMQPAVTTGAVKVVRQGKDAQGKDCWLVVGKKLVVANDCVESSFAYSQKHILGTVIPQLEKRYSELVMNISKEDAEARAKSTGMPCYYIDRDDEPAMAVPDNYKGVNEAQKIRKTIAQWRDIIGNNERKKHEYATGNATPFKRYSVSEQPLEYSESASGYKTGYEYWTSGGHVSGGFSFGGGGKDNDKTSTMDKSENNTKDAAERKSEIYVAGFAWSFKINPLASTYAIETSQKAYSKTMKGYGYKLDMRNNGYLDMDVFKEPGAKLLSKDDWDWVTANMEGSVSGVKTQDDVNTGEFIYVLRGGAQRSPWFDADTSYVYTMAGKHVELGARTKKIDNPKIYIENPVVSNVKRDGKAIYSVRLSNETEYNGNVSLLTPIPLYLRIADEYNPKGAKVTMDGVPLSDGRKFDLAPGQSITKTIEVARGEGYDFDNLGLVFRDESYTLIDTAKFSVHFTPESCPVTLTLPKDKWVMNTLSDKDPETGRFFLPVEISGFTTAYEGFDHIELQYKKQTEGESQWVNLCSFYADPELYDKASGVKRMITKDCISDFAFYGEKDTIEMKYDIRAVSFCRLGTGFVSRASNVSSGIKDTRPPKVFGSPTPANGILAYGDVITVPFNEPIAYNYLDGTANFSVRGFTNNSDANHSTRLRFSGDDDFAETNVERSFKNTDFTIEMNAQVEKGSDAIFFLLAQEQANYEDILAFAYSAEDDAFVGIVNNKVYLSAPLGKKNLPIHDMMTHVGMVYSTNDKEVWFIGGSDTLSVVSVTDGFSEIDKNVKPSEKITGTIAIGSSMTGYLSDVRIWNRALNTYEIANKFGKKLSASEKDLMAWWPMDEAYGNVVADKANGADLILHHASWETPKGFSAKLDGKPLNINKDVRLFQTAENQDFSLGFWFKVDSLNTADVPEGGLVDLFAAGSEKLADKGEGKMRIGFDSDNKLVLRTEGNTIDFGIGNDYVELGQWHYLTLVANHSQNLASLYINGNMVNETSADRIGSISGSQVSFGSAGYHGYIDEISMWHLALPQSYINDMKTTALTGREKELNAYISFEADERQDDNQMATVFSPLNQKVSENTGKIVGDLMFDPSTVEHEEAIHAPMKKDVGIANIDFSWTCTDNALQINLLSRDADINNQRIDLVLRGVEDLQGNPMANPLMWSVYVNKNVMKWNSNTIKADIQYGKDKTISAQWKNISGRSVNYTVDTKSQWLKLDRIVGLAAPLEESEVGIKISDGLAPGTYQAIINLTDESGLTSKLIVVANVVADEPDWTVTTAQDYQETMSVTAKVMVEGAESMIVDTDVKDIVAAFYNGVCLGKANVTFQGENSAYVYLNIRGKKEFKGKALQFYLWDSSRGEIRRLKRFGGPAVVFRSDSIAGTHSDPVVFVCDSAGMQTVTLNQGWNWVSFNLRSSQKSGVKNLFIDNSVFSNGDIIKGSLGNAKHAEYVEKYNSWSSGADDMAIGIGNVYQIYVSKPTTVEFEGYEIDDDDRNVTLAKNAWSQLPYLLKVPQPVNIAMSGYQISGEGHVGTVIKSHDKFTVADADGHWYGSLDYMRPGEGYYINNVGDACVVKFTNNNVLNESVAVTDLTRAAGGNSIAAEYADAMPVIATFADDDVAEGDVLVAYCNGMEVGRADATSIPTNEDDRNVYFLMVNASNGSAIHFAKERDGKTVAVTDRGIEFISTGIVGTLNNPYVIDFSRNASGGVYDISGRKYTEPAQLKANGVYIINGEKRIRH